MLIQPNILLFTLNENSSNLISVNNDNNNIQVLPIKPIINSCENNGDIITVNGLFLKNLQLKYTYNFQGGISFVENNFFICLFENKPESYPILKPQQQMELSSHFNYYFYIDCTNCDGGNLVGLSKNYTKNTGGAVKVNIYDVTLNDDGGIYFEARNNYPFTRSGALQLPTDILIISDNEIFEFNGSSIVSISGYFIPKVYANQPYIIGILEFSNGSIYNLDYNTLNNKIISEGKFNIPCGYGNGNFSIYIKDKLWISSFTQNQEKVQLHLSFSLSLFPITSIKYNDKNGKDLDYTLIEPNIISFNLKAYSTNVFSFNDDYHNETLPNGSNFRPIIYSFSIENDVITMEGLFLSKLSNYKFYLGDSKNAVSIYQVTYLDISKLGLIMNQALHVYVYSDENSFTKVPDITITSEQDQLLFTCSNCLGGSININEPQSNQDSQFSEIGTIVKHFNTNTIVNKYNIFTFTKDSRTIVIQPPLPTNLIFDASLPKLPTFSNNTIIISSDFLMDKYNGFDYTDFQLQFDNGTIYSVKKPSLSKSAQNFKYQTNAPFAFGSVSTFKIDGFKIIGDGFFNVSLIASYIKNLGNTTTDDFNEFPITILIKSRSDSLFKFEPFYIQSYFYNPNSDSDSKMNNDISLHSVLSKLVATLFVIISILLQ
ncbi:hypothetical protein ACTFIY_004864 [Dictyostelium cf. discoideum]